MKDIETSEIIEFIIDNNATVRETAQKFNVSRQTISNRVLKSKNNQAKNILDLHFKYKSKNKYLKVVE